MGTAQAGLRRPLPPQLSPTFDARPGVAFQASFLHDHGLHAPQHRFTVQGGQFGMSLRKVVLTTASALRSHSSGASVGLRLFLP